MICDLSAAITTARQKRNTLLTESTNCFRLIDAAGDHVPDLWIDWFDGRALIQIKDGASITPDELQTISQALQARSVYLKRLDQHQKEAPAYVSGERVEQPFDVREHGISYEIDFMSGYSQGIFLDQRDNRLEVKTRMEQRGKDSRLLNLFAYTCGFSVAAAKGCAATTSIDLSRTYLDWGKRNFQLNGLDPSDHYFVKGDVFEWLLAFARKGRTWHGIVLDPPTFSRGEKKKVFRVESDYAELVQLAAKVLEPGGWLLCCANTRTVSSAIFQEQVTSGIEAAGRTIRKKNTTPMPPDFTGEQYLKSLWVTAD